jgi:hypothetical protein
MPPVISTNGGAHGGGAAIPRLGGAVRALRSPASAAVHLALVRQSWQKASCIARGTIEAVVGAGLDRGICAGDGAGDLRSYNQGGGLPGFQPWVRLARVAVPVAVDTARKHTLRDFDACVEDLVKFEELVNATVVWLVRDAVPARSGRSGDWLIGATVAAVVVTVAAFVATVSYSHRYKRGRAPGAVAETVGPGRREPLAGHRLRGVLAT